MRKIMIVLVGVAVVVVACSKGSSGGNSGMVTSVDCSGAVKSFSADVNPIIQSSCAINSGCHAAGSVNGPGPLLTYQQIFNARFAIRAAVASGFMPQNSTLSASQKNNILCWVDNGATNN
jgi:hypothetical protein